MRTNVRKTAQLGELVAAVFDEAARYSSNPEEVSRLATRAVMRMLRRVRKTSLLRHPRWQTPRWAAFPDGGRA